MGYNEILNKAAAYCAMSEKCEYDVLAKLEAWEVSKDMAAKVIKQLIQDQFIDDTRYAIAFVKDKFRFNQWGKIKIKAYLQAKRISPESISEALNAIDNAEYEALLVKLLQDKLRTLKYNYEYEKQGKLFLYAQRKGFESQAISDALKLM